MVHVDVEPKSDARVRLAEASRSLRLYADRHFGLHPSGLPRRGRLFRHQGIRRTI